MKYRILFHSHVFVHKAHAVFFRLSEPRKVLIMADYPLIGMQFFRGPCFSRSAVHRQIAGDFETFAPVFLALVRLAGQDHAGSRGDREQEFRLTWSKTESSTPSSGFRRCSSPYRRDSSLWIRRRVPFPRWSSFSSGVSVFFGPFSFIPFPYSGGFPWIL